MRRAGLVAFALLLAAACSGSLKRPAAPSTTTTTSPNPFATPGASSAAAPGGSIQGSLEVGECFDADTFQAGAPIDVASTHPTSCAVAHQHEVYDAGAYPAAVRTPYPGDDTLTAYLDDRCIAAFAAYVGIDYQQSKLDFATVRPNRSSWDRGDRQVACVLHDADFVALTGSMRNSGR